MKAKLCNMSKWKIKNSHLAQIPKPKTSNLHFKTHHPTILKSNLQQTAKSLPKPTLCHNNSNPLRYIPLYLSKPLYLPLSKKLLNHSYSLCLISQSIRYRDKRQSSQKKISKRRLPLVFSEIQRAMLYSTT